jgi:nitrile hydratase
MDGIHDLGGRHGFGGSLAERDEVNFHAEWEKRVFAMYALLAMQGCTNGDEGRHWLERLDPVTYLTAGYYGRWLASMENRLASDALRPGSVADPSASRTIEWPARFAPGDAVRTRNQHPPGHTRLPGYARGRRGQVLRCHGGFVLPDARAHGLGDRPEHAYAVRFEGEELWGDAAEPGTRVHLDLFESYLEPA